MSPIRTIIFSLIAMLALGLSLQAGVYVVQKVESSNPEESGVNRMYIDSDYFRFETETPAEHIAMIYRSDKQLFWIIDLRQKTYFEMTREGMQKVANQAHDMMDQMMANMTEEQKQAMQMMKERIKQQMEDMSDEEKEAMSQHMPPGMAEMHTGMMEEVVYKKAADGERVGKYNCTKYEGYKGKYRVEEVWATSISSLGVNESDFAVFEKMEAFSKEMTGPMADMIGEEGMGFSSPTSDEKGFPGLPVKEVTYDMGRVSQTTTIQEVVKKNFGPELFELPANLTKTDPLKGMGEGMPQY